MSWFTVALPFMILAIVWLGLYQAKRSFKSKLKPTETLKDIDQDELDIATNFARASQPDSPTLFEIMFRQHFTIKEYTPLTGDGSAYPMKNIDPDKPITVYLNDGDTLYELGISPKYSDILSSVLTDMILKQGSYGPKTQPPE